ncbi:hypothetical protein [Fodinicurvata sediminis]|uniref:hypothetical protein n=1 Tax=Fodinicurvata sediminis TaxID=1121832 RepID=UPI0003B538A5|nr:hypothetical protein [Fodinicurvata sediminis]
MDILSALGTAWNWLMLVFAWGTTALWLLTVGGIAIVALGIGLVRLWQQGPRALLALVPSWWTIGMLAAVGAGIYVIDSLDLYSARGSTAAIMMMFLTAMAVFGVHLWQQSVERDILDRARMEEKNRRQD